MDHDDTGRKLLLGIVIKVIIVIGLGTAFAFWHLARL